MTPSAETRTPAGPSAVRRGASTGHRWLLLAFLLLGVVQIFLAGLGVFSLHGQNPGAAGETAFGPHRSAGFAMGGVAFLILVLALIARPGTRAIVLSVVLVLLAFLGPGERCRRCRCRARGARTSDVLGVLLSDSRDRRGRNG
jgi:hypothetical protein